MLTRLYENGLYLPARLRRGVSSLWRETDGGGGWPCCCNPHPGSTSTRGSTSTVRQTVTGNCGVCISNVLPRYFRISLSGVVNGTSCSNCSPLNADFIVESQIAAGAACTYSVPFTALCTGICFNSRTINQVILAFQATSVVVNFGNANAGSTISNTVPGFNFVTTPGANSLNCLTLSNYNIPFNNNFSCTGAAPPTLCDASAATCTITAL